jgi:hypothetical protein
MMVGGLRWTNARFMAAELRVYARGVEGGIGDGWFEKDRPRTLDERRQVVAALRWLAEVFERYAPKQPPTPRDET